MGLSFNSKVLFWLTIGFYASEVNCQQVKALVLDDSSFDTALIDYPKLAVFFTDSQCKRCGEVEPTWQELSQEYTGISSELVLATINLSKNPSIQKKYGVRYAFGELITEILDQFVSDDENFQ